MREYIRIKNMQAGQILGSTLYDEKGRVLLKAGNQLTSKAIEVIKDQGYKGIYIENNSDTRVEDIPIPEPIIPDDVRINIISTIKEAYYNTDKFLHPFDNKFAIQRKKLDQFVSELVDKIIELDMEHKFILEIENTGTVKDFLFTHSLNTCLISIGIAHKMGLDYQTVYEIGLAGLYHDMGKGMIDQKIVLKKDPSEEEKDKIKTHTEIMFRLLQKLNYPINVTYGIWMSHEKIDGSGYPNKLTSDKIVIAARIVGLASKLDNLINASPYCEDPLLQKDAIEYLLGCKYYDAECVIAMNKFVVPFGVGLKVKLSNGQLGLVLKNNASFPLRPYILNERDMNNMAKDKKYMNVVIENLTE